MTIKLCLTVLLQVAIYLQKFSIGMIYAVNSDVKHRARLCHLKIWPEFTGYGFNLHAEKGKIVQYIGKVDDNSPAELAGLKEHDRIVEVNGVSVSGEAHQDVVKRIKSDPKQVTMLVVDKETDAYFEKEGLVPSSHLQDVERITCPDVQPYFEHIKHHNDVGELYCFLKVSSCSRVVVFALYSR